MLSRNVGEYRGITVITPINAARLMTDFPNNVLIVWGIKAGRKIDKSHRAGKPYRVGKGGGDTKVGSYPRVDALCLLGATIISVLLPVGNHAALVLLFM